MARAVATFLIAVLLVGSSGGAPVFARPTASIYRVSPQDVDRFTWSGLRAGDTVILGPGTYRTTIRLNVRGTPAAPITIQASGTVIFFGGRSTPLPYCDQRSYRVEAALRHAFEIGNAAHVVLDGMDMRGLTIHGYNGSGITLDRAARNITLRNLHIYDNGDVARVGGGWAPNRWGSSEGIELSGTNVTVERAIIHDNAADALQSGGGVHTFTLRQSWLYNSRTAPDGDIFNRCTHQDGIQIFAGGVQSGVTVEDSVIGPGLLQGIIIGDRATVHDVTIRNTRFEATDNTHIIAKTNMRNWVIEDVTFGPYKHQAMRLGDKRYLGTQIGAGASITVPAELGAGPNVADSPGGSAFLPPWIRLALGGLFGETPAAPSAEDVPPRDTVPEGACKTAAQYAIEAMARHPRYSQGGHLAGDPLGPDGQPLPRTGPHSFDCSGLTWAAYRSAGVNIGWVVSTQARAGVRIPCTMANFRGAATTCWEVGDLLFLHAGTPSHVAIYVGGGQVADCLNHAENCIIHDPSTNRYFQEHFWQARRIDPACARRAPHRGNAPAGTPRRTP